MFTCVAKIPLEFFTIIDDYVEINLMTICFKSYDKRLFLFSKHLQLGSLLGSSKGRSNLRDYVRKEVLAHSGPLAH